MALSKEQMADLIASNRKHLRKWLSITFITPPILLLAVCFIISIRLIPREIETLINLEQRDKISGFKSELKKFPVSSYKLNWKSPTLLRIWDLQTEGKKITVVVANDYEDQFLNDIEGNNLYIPIKSDEKLNTSFYPKPELWKDFISTTLAKDRNQLILTGTLQRIPLFIKQIVFHDNPLVTGIAIGLPLGIIFSILEGLKLSKRRRRIFLENFDFSHIKDASPCMIDSTYKPNKKLSHLSGRIYSIKENAGSLVIWNGTADKTLNGFLLQYKDQYFFIPEEWHPNFGDTKAA